VACFAFLAESAADHHCAVWQEEVAKDLGIPVACQRYWLWAKRQNHTYRPNRPLNEHEEAQTV
jgi:ubiquitin carboxyl-terminal hydrolase 7